MNQMPIAIVGELTIYRVAEIKAVLDAALHTCDGSSAITLDLAAVSELDAAGMQLLMAFERAVTAAGGTLALTHTPAPLFVQLTQYDVAGRFLSSDQGTTA